MGACSTTCKYRFIRVPYSPTASDPVVAIRSAKNSGDKPYGLKFGETETSGYSFIR